MIPLILPPLAGLSVLVTRPAPQAAALAASIRARRGEPIVFPSIAIEAIDAPVPEEHALVIFISANAVEHGAKLLRKTTGMRIAAIGKSTAAALAAANLPPDLVPEGDSTSEALLAHPDLNVTAGQRVLIIKGAGGREALFDAFTSRGISVSNCEVYRRVPATVSAAEIAALETHWETDGIDVVTATSVETYTNLTALLTARGLALLQQSTLLAPTQRILDAARARGWQGGALISGGADDTSILHALARWHARARSA